MLLTAKIELTVPAFLGGARAREADRYFLMRPSSVRGALREWFRMGAAAVLWPQPIAGDNGHRRMLQRLREIEREVFGGVHGDGGAVRSRLIVTTSGGSLCRVRPPEPARWPGLRYLGYGIFDGERDPEALVTSPPRGLACEAIPSNGAADTPLHLRLALRPRGPRERVPAGLDRLVCASFWLWTHLGGLGARTRRGFGSMHTGAVDGAAAWPDLAPADTRGALAQGLIDGVEWATAQFRETLPRFGIEGVETGDGRPHPLLRTLHGIDAAHALPFDGPEPIAVLDHAGRLFRDFRSTLQRNRLGLPPLPDYFNVKHALQRGDAPSAVERAAFGLPLPFYFRSLGGRKTNFVPAEGDRMASPLLFRVHRLAAGRYTVVLVDLSENAAGGPLAGARLVQAESKRPVAAPDGRLIRDFITWAREQVRRSPPAFGGTR